MTDQCFDEPDRGREPTTLSVNTTDDSTTYSYTLPEEWIRINTGVIRNTASKLELAKMKFGIIMSMSANLNNELLDEIHAVAKEALEQLLEDL